MDTDKRIERIEDNITNIKENHLFHIEADLSRTSANVDWLMKYHWIIATASIGALVTGIINLLK